MAAKKDKIPYAVVYRPLASSNRAVVDDAEVVYTDKALANQLEQWSDGGWETALAIILSSGEIVSSKARVLEIEVVGNVNSSK